MRSLWIYGVRGTGRQWVVENALRDVPEELVVVLSPHTGASYNFLEQFSVRLHSVVILDVEKFDPAYVQLVLEYAQSRGVRVICTSTMHPDEVDPRTGALGRRIGTLIHFDHVPRVQDREAGAGAGSGAIVLTPTQQEAWAKIQSDHVFIHGRAACGKTTAVNEALARVPLLTDGSVHYLRRLSDEIPATAKIIVIEGGGSPYELACFCECELTQAARRGQMVVVVSNFDPQAMHDALVEDSAELEANADNAVGVGSAVDGTAVDMTNVGAVHVGAMRHADNTEYQCLSMFGSVIHVTPYHTEAATPTAALEDMHVEDVDAC
jgi:hypothetical protein